MRIPHVFVAVALAAAAAGCFSVGPQDATVLSYHEIELPPPPPADRRIGTSLVLRPFAQDSALDREEIRYRNTPTSGSYFGEHLWVQSVASMVRGALQADLEAWGGFERVLLLDNAGAAEYLLVGEVNRFEELDAKDGSWLAVAEATFELTRAGDGEILWHRRIRVEEPAAERTAASLVRALSAATGKIAAELRAGLAGAIGGGE